MESISKPLGGAILALALVAAITSLATVAMTITTALGLAWPDALFTLLAFAIAAALAFACLRALSSTGIAFAGGVAIAALPTLFLAARHEINHWDDFMTWLGNAIYIWTHGGFPTPAAPPVASVWPGYPPAFSFVLASVWSSAGRVVETAGPVINVACLLLLPALVMRVVADRAPRDVCRRPRHWWRLPRPSRSPPNRRCRAAPRGRPIGSPSGRSWRSSSTSSRPASCLRSCSCWRSLC
jgi:hypothetical protein